jgi:DNA-binding NarL/FixJ family response regulator
MSGARTAPAWCTTTYRIVVAEDSFLIREGIGKALEDEDEIEIVENCSDLPSLFAAIERHQPDAVITAIRIPPTNTDEGVLAAVTLRKSNPDIGVVVISRDVTPENALRVFEQGSAGRADLLEHRVGHRLQLLEAIREVAAGRSVVDPKVVDVLAEARTRARNSPVAQLTARQHEVLAGIAAGKSNAAIAGSLCLTKRAIEKNIHSIFSTLKLREDADIDHRVTAALIYRAHTPVEAEGAPSSR